MTISPELKEAVERAGREPVRLTDPETNDAYYLLKEEVFDRIRGAVAPSTATSDVPEGVARSKAAFLRDLPALLARRRQHGRWVAYRGDERVGIARREAPLIRECLRRGCRPDEFYTGTITPHAPEPEEVAPGGNEVRGELTISP